MAAECGATGRLWCVRLASVGAAAAAVLAGSVAHADVRSFAAAADNTIFRRTAAPQQRLSNGVGDGIYVGRTWFHAQFLQRGLIRFDLSSIPCGAVVTRAELTLFMERGPSSQPDTPVGLHRLVGAWGEGDSSAFGGTGSDSAVGDANWKESQHPDVLWNTPGGDFVSAASASALVSTSPSYVTWGSNQTMIADVAGWLSNPGSNHGWLLLGNEAAEATARKFASRESPTESYRPVLVVEYTPATAAVGIVEGPAAVTVCPGGRAGVSVTAAGSGPLSYAWQLETAPGVWTTLGNDPAPFACSGGGTGFAFATPRDGASADVVVSGCAALSGYRVRAVVTGACGSATSEPAAVTVVARCSLADVAGTVLASGAATCGDGTVDGTDFIAFINSFGVGDAAVDPVADVAGGGGDGLEPDGTIDGTDFIAFINAFGVGC